MKNILIVTLVIGLLFVFSTQAQSPIDNEIIILEGQDQGPINEGSIVVGGHAFYMSQSGGDFWRNANEEAFNTFAVQPHLGYFVGDNLMLGGMLSANRISRGEHSLTEFRIGPVLGYYFDFNREEIEGSLFPFVKVFVLFESIDLGEKLDNVTYITYGGQFGCDYMISNSFAINVGGQIHISSNKDKFDNETYTRATIMFGVGLEFFKF